jgi:small-conductance mechanosensitive channel
LGYTRLRTPDGRLIVLPNAIAASQVIINLNNTFAPWPLNIAIRLNRDASIEEAQKLAVRVARERAGDATVIGCYLTRVDSSGITLELRLRARDATERDALRTQLLSVLPSQFVQAKIGSVANELPSFNISFG